MRYKAENLDEEPPHPSGRFALPYDDAEFEFIKAVDKFKREKQRRFLAHSEYLAILRQLGYRKVADPTVTV